MWFQRMPSLKASKLYSCSDSAGSDLYRRSGFARSGLYTCSILFGQHIVEPLLGFPAYFLSLTSYTCLLTLQVLKSSGWLFEKQL